MKMMNVNIEALKVKLAEVEAERDARGKEWSKLEGKESDVFYKNVMRPLSREIDDLKEQITSAKRFQVKVGDGVTLHLYSDSQAHTVIKRTAKTITIQRDKATRNPDFKPEFISGGFSAHCTNQDEQTYTYESNPEGSITVCRWSERLGCYTTGGDQSIKIYNGRHEFYDYNF
jgi:hypothetical protein